MPLAGHELGHTTWQSKKLDALYGQKIWATIVQIAKTRSTDYKRVFDREFDTDLFMGQNLAPAYQWSLRQAEETFCDFFGLRLFGESYLHAFAYLVSPGGGHRDSYYPNLADRIGNMQIAATQMSLTLPTGFVNAFANEITQQVGEKEQFQLSVSDGAAASLRDELLAKATEIADSVPTPRHTTVRVEAVKTSFRRMVPAANIGDLTTILAAAWELYYETDLWKETVPSEGRLSTLNELVLKSIEILEFEERTKG